MTEPATDLIDRIVADVEKVSGVAGLDAGSLGVVATYLPGRRIVGVRMHDDFLEVHIAVFYGSNVHDVASNVRKALKPLSNLPVEVVIETIVTA